MDEREDLIQAINKLREEMGLDLYDTTYLEEKTIEELEKLFNNCFNLREDQRKGLKEKAGFKLNWKSGLIISITIVVIILGFIVVQKVLISSGQDESVLSIPFIRPVTEESLREEFKFTVSYITNTEQNLSLFTIVNLGNNTLENFIVKIDGEETDYQIKKGYMPLSFGQSSEFTIFNVCNKEHSIKVIVDGSERTIIINPNICKERNQE